MFFCNTTAIASLKCLIGYFFTSIPFILTVPLVASYNLGISDTSVVLAEPVCPIIPIVCPASILNETSERTYSFASFLYLNHTWSNSIEPFSTLISSACSSVMSIFSSRTSTILEAEAKERVIIRNTFDIIISELSIRRT